MGLAGVNPFLGDNGTMDLVFISLAIALLIPLSFLGWRLKTSTTAEPARKGPYVLPPDVVTLPASLC